MLKEFIFSDKHIECYPSVNTDDNLLFIEATIIIRRVQKLNQSQCVQTGNCTNYFQMGETVAVGSLCMRTITLDLLKSNSFWLVSIWREVIPNWDLRPLNSLKWKKFRTNDSNGNCLSRYIGITETTQSFWINSKRFRNHRHYIEFGASIISIQWEHFAWFPIA